MGSFYITTTLQSLENELVFQIPELIRSIISYIMIENLGHGPDEEIQPLPQVDFGDVVKSPTKKGMRFTEPSMSDKARYADPKDLVAIPTASGYALVTKGELNKDK